MKCLQVAMLIFILYYHPGSGQEVGSTLVKSGIQDNSSLQRRKNQPVAPQVFSSSNLPILLIETEGNAQIPDEPKISANLGIIYNGPGLRNYITDIPDHYNGNIGIELRGNSTKHYPKKPYNIETRDSLGENLNIPLFGMPPENDWVLRASYFDHTFIRNPLAMHMSRLTGRWASRTQLVEVVLNGNYQGIYIFMEKIKRDKARLDIAKLDSTDKMMPDITGGYIYEIAGHTDDFGESRKLKYPKFEDAIPEQIAYIKNVDDDFREIMRGSSYTDEISGYQAHINVESFIDEIIVQEAMRNSDAYGWSGYFYKPREGKIHAGPVWDFDQSAGNSSYPDDGIFDGWLFNHEETNNTPFFWKKLFDDPVFSYKVRQRWETLRESKFKTENLFEYIDSIAADLSEAQMREFTKWPVLGEYIWRETEGYEQRNTYQKEVDYLKTFLLNRWEWMDYELAGYDNPNPGTLISSGHIAVSDILIYPNPAKEYVTFEITGQNNAEAQIHILNSLGMLMQSSDIHHLHNEMNKIVIVFEGLYPTGIYNYKITLNNLESYTGLFVKIE